MQQYDGAQMPDPARREGGEPESCPCCGAPAEAVSLAAHQLGTTRPGDWRALLCPHTPEWKARLREAAEEWAAVAYNDAVFEHVDGFVRNDTAKAKAEFLRILSEGGEGE